MTLTAQLNPMQEPLLISQLHGRYPLRQRDCRIRSDADSELMHLNRYQVVAARRVKTRNQRTAQTPLCSSGRRRKRYNWEISLTLGALLTAALAFAVVVNGIGTNRNFAHFNVHSHAVVHDELQ